MRAAVESDAWVEGGEEEHGAEEGSGSDMVNSRKPGEQHRRTGRESKRNE